jgi:hypothetical protein
MGLAPLPAAAKPGEAVDQISLEQLDLVDGDILLLLNFGGDGDGSAALRERSLFANLRVAKAGQGRRGARGRRARPLLRLRPHRRSQRSLPAGRDQPSAIVLGCPVHHRSSADVL